MKFVSYIMMWFGLMGAIWGENESQRTGGMIVMAAGFVVYVVVRILDRVDPNGSDDL